MGELVLAFDTATDRCALALDSRSARGEGSFEPIVADFDAPRAALGRLLPAVERLLAGAGVTPGDLSAIVVGRGPGSFTGVRIGVATAKGLAHGLGVPLYGVPTLDAVAWEAAAGTEGLLGVVGDAMRGEIYPALFRLAGGRAERLGPDTVMQPAAAAALWAELDEPLLLSGDGLRKYADTFVPALTAGPGVELLPERLWLPGGAGLLTSFEAAFLTGAQGDGDPATLLPIYTRLSDAEEAERAKEAGR